MFPNREKLCEKLMEAILLVSDKRFMGEKTQFEIATEHGIHVVTVSVPRVKHLVGER